jgi:hypothetical protein
VYVEFDVTVFCCSGVLISMFSMLPHLLLTALF